MFTKYIHGNVKSIVSAVLFEDLYMLHYHIYFSICLAYMQTCLLFHYFWKCPTKVAESKKIYRTDLVSERSLFHKVCVCVCWENAN